MAKKSKTTKHSDQQKKEEPFNPGGNVIRESTMNKETVDKPYYNKFKEIEAVEAKNKQRTKATAKYISYSDLCNSHRTTKGYK